MPRPYPQEFREGALALVRGASSVVSAATIKALTVDGEEIRQLDTTISTTRRAIEQATRNLEMKPEVKAFAQGAPRTRRGGGGQHERRLLGHLAL